MQTYADISRSFGAASSGHRILADRCMFAGRGSHHKGAKPFYAARLVNGRAVFISGLSRYHSYESVDSTLCQVHTATPVRQQCAGSPLGIRVSGERLGTKNQNPGNADLRTGARWKFPNRA